MIQQYEPSYQFPRLQEQLTLPELVEKWKEAKKALKECQNQARELRYKRYEDLLIYYEVDSSPDSRRRANIVKSTLRTERCRETYRSIRLSTKPFGKHTGGLKSILIPHITRNINPNMEATGSVDIYSWLSQNPGGASQWDRIILREELETHLLHYNKASFRAASASPCGHGAILQDLTFSTLSPAGHDLLNGKFPETWYNQDKLLREFLLSFRTDQVHTVSPIITSITTDDVRKGFGCWHETTTSSPSGRHLGHIEPLSSMKLYWSA